MSGHILNAVGSEEEGWVLSLPTREVGKVRRGPTDAWDCRLRLDGRKLDMVHYSGREAIEKYQEWAHFGLPAPEVFQAYRAQMHAELERRRIAESEAVRAQNAEALTRLRAISKGESKP